MGGDARFLCILLPRALHSDPCLSDRVTFCVCLFSTSFSKGSAYHQKLGAKSQKTLLSPTNKQSSAMLGGSCINMKATVLCLAILRRRRQMT